MKKLTLNWKLSHSKCYGGALEETVEATVPGAVQLDYAKALGYPPYWRGTNFRQFDWMENEFFIYEAELDFKISPFECALLHFEGIDYKYEIEINGRILASGEGAFTPVSIDVSPYAGKKTPVKVTLYPIPKEMPWPQKRFQARSSCKPASSYGWDWHPRLVPSGIYAPAYIDVFPLGSPKGLEASYRLSDDLKSVTVSASVDVYGMGEFTASITDPSGNTVASEKRIVGEAQTETFTLTFNDPKLWYPRGYGDQPLYTLKVQGNDKVEKRIGFRRSKLIQNEGATRFEDGWPKGPISAPMQLEINGRRIFCKGSNWVNTEIFPCLATDERYDELISLALDANMNIFRLWGGQYINHEHFYEKCDEVGILIWQEFMLSCNLHPDSDEYLAVLKNEATSIIKRLRTHPCLAFWCGGNELFNSWSGMTCQSHPLRMLDSLCYELDRFTPFNMTSPLHGVHHGSYVKAMISAEDRKNGNYSIGEEFICAVKRTKGTAYTEFGCNGASPKDYILKYIMDEKDFADCRPENANWLTHHAFKAWDESTWIGIPEIHYFFGGFTDTSDLVEKSIYLQDLCYKTTFEEMRRQAPLCSMVINWDFNEPWPCAAGNSLVNWPAEPKSCLKSVKEALRPTLLSLEMPRNRYLTGETLDITAWLLNDCDDAAPGCTADVFLITNGEKKKLQSVSFEQTGARSNLKGESLSIVIDESIPERFSIAIECKEDPGISSVYNLVHKVC